MGPKQKLATLAWCLVTMLGTMVLSHGHLIMREIMAHWPKDTSWESRFENALYAQGAFCLVASLALSVGLFAKSYIQRNHARDQANRDRMQRERHERQSAQRHEEMMESLAQLSGNSPTKKLVESGFKPR
ncbi:MAG: hypothetical protein ABL921_28205 [Pirellula sp.]